VLAMLTGQPPEMFQDHVNTQDPVSWSSALRPYGLRLAYCPTDVRRLCFYLPELVALDDLFTLSYYSPTDGATILQDPDTNDWVCSSHIVVLHRSEILDPAKGEGLDARSHPCGDHHTKRIFRLVPAEHERGCDISMNALISVRRKKARLKCPCIVIGIADHTKESGNGGVLIVA